MPLRPVLIEDDGPLDLPKFTALTPVPVEEEELSFEEIHGPMPWHEMLRISLGRGAMDLIQGAKQGALMIRDPEEAKKYTENINQEIRRFEEGVGKEHPVGSFLGRMTGTALPLAAMGPARWPAAALAGAVEGGMLFTPEADPLSKAVNAGIGSALTGGTQGLMNSFFRLPKPSTQESARAVAAAADENVGLRPQDISDNPLVQLFGSFGEAGALARSAAAPGSREAAELLLGETKRVEDLLTSAKNAITKNKEQQRRLYRTLAEQMEGANIRINPKGIRTLSQDLIDEQIKSGLPNQTVVKKLEKIRSAVPEGNTFDSWKRFRTQLGDQMVQWNKEGVSVAPIERMYGEVTKHLKAAAAVAGPKAQKTFDDANALTSIMLNLKKTPTGRLVEKQQGSKLVNMLRGGTDRQKDTIEAAQALFDVLDDSGRESARHILINDVLEEATDIKGRFQPSVFSKGLKNIRNRSEVFFKDRPELVENMDRLQILMAHAKDPDQAGILSKIYVPTFISGAGGAIGGAIGGPEAITAGATAGLIAAEAAIPLMTRSRSVNALIDSLNKHKPGSKESKKIVAEIYRLMQAFPAYSATAAVLEPDAPLEPALPLPLYP